MEGSRKGGGRVKERRWKGQEKAVNVARKGGGMLPTSVLSPDMSITCGQGHRCV